MSEFEEKKQVSRKFFNSLPFYWRREMMRSNVAMFIAGGLFLGCFSCLQGEIDISQYKKAEILSSKAVEVSIPNADFLQGEYGWTMEDGYKIDPTGGRNGGPCLYYERTDPKAYQLCTSQKIKVNAGQTYKFGVWIRVESLAYKSKPVFNKYLVWNEQSSTASADTLQCLAMEGSKNGKYLYGFGKYLTCPAPSKEWSYVSGEIASTENCEAHLTLYMSREVTGKIWFANPKIECADFETWLLHKLYPKKSMLFQDNGTATFKVARIGSQPEGMAAYAELRNDTKILSVADATPDKDGIVNLNFGTGLPAGDAKILLKAVDMNKKLILAEKEIPVRIERKEEDMKGVSIDTKGRTIINGKPFMPVGIYLSGDLICREDISRLSGTSFNCIIPYGSAWMKFKDSKKEGLAAIREILDELDKNNIKIIFTMNFYDGCAKYDTSISMLLKKYGLKKTDDLVRLFVKEFKDHPALLAWYVCDEFEEEWLERIEQRRNLVNSLDGKHPTWAVYCKLETLHLFASTSDIIGVDIYPVKELKDHDMGMVKSSLDKANMAIGTQEGTALWVVSQVFNWANYLQAKPADRESRLKNFVDPTEDEMRSMCLLDLIKGAKGIICYSYFDLFYRGGEPDADKRWPEVCRVAEMLKGLAPFILSEKNAPSIKVENRKGVVVAKAFSDDQGRTKVLIAGIGPGKSDAVIHLPEGLTLKSKYGKTQQTTPGQYTFQGEDICSDILE